MNPDAVFIATVSGAEGILTGLKAADIKAQVLSYDLFNTPTTTALPAAQGSIYAVQNFDLAASDDTTQGFVKVFKEQNGGKEPNSQQVQSANAIILTAELIAKLQKAGKDVNAANILAEGTALKEADLVGGPITIKRPGAYAISGIKLLTIANQATSPTKIFTVDEVTQMQKLAGL
jgi:hypothetical protein